MSEHNRDYCLCPHLDSTSLIKQAPSPSPVLIKLILLLTVSGRWCILLQWGVTQEGHDSRCELTLSPLAPSCCTLLQCAGSVPVLCSRWPQGTPGVLLTIGRGALCLSPTSPHPCPSAAMAKGCDGGWGGADQGRSLFSSLSSAPPKSLPAFTPSLADRCERVLLSGSFQILLKTLRNPSLGYEWKYW